MLPQTMFPQKVNVKVITFLWYNERLNQSKEETHVQYTSQQVHQVEVQALNDICSGMHLTHQFPAPEMHQKHQTAVLWHQICSSRFQFTNK